MTEDSNRNHQTEEAIRLLAWNLQKMCGSTQSEEPPLPQSYPHPRPERIAPTFLRALTAVQVPEDYADAVRKTNEQVLKQARMHRIKLLKLEQCHRCQLHCGSEHLNCAVNPTFLNDSEQETCGHYEEEIIIEDPGKWHRPHLGEAPDPIPLPNHIGEPPHPTPLRMMVSEDGLRVRAHLQALGIYMEDYSCSDNCPESQSEDY